MESLDVAIEDLGNLKRKITVTVPKEEVKNAYDKCYLSLKDKVSINGFRKGKYPQSLLEKRFTKVMKDEAVETLVPKYYEKALQQEGLKPAGRPQFGDLEVEKQKPLVFSATFEIFAAFNEPEPSAFSIENKVVDVTEEEIKEHRQRHLNSAATFSPKDGNAAEGDQVIIEFNGKVEEENIAESQNQQYIIGSNQFLPEFEAALMGMGKGEEKNFDLTFPADYNEEKLREKTANFWVKVNEIKIKTDPELNDDFFKRYGEKVKSEDDFDKMIREEVEFRKQNEIKSEQRKAIREQLDPLLDFEIPAQLLQEEISIRLRQAKQKAENNERSDEELEAEVRTGAEKDLRFSILVQKMLDEKELTPDSAEVYRRFEINCAMMGIQPQELMQQQYGQQIYQQIFGMVAEEAVLDYIIKSVLEK